MMLLVELLKEAKAETPPSTCEQRVFGQLTASESSDGTLMSSYLSLLSFLTKISEKFYSEGFNCVCQHVCVGWPDGEHGNVAITHEDLLFDWGLLTYRR
jgi:hypothetical protein